MLALPVLGKELTALVDTRNEDCKIKRRRNASLQSFTFATVPFPRPAWDDLRSAQCHEAFGGRRLRPCRECAAGTKSLDH
jgi:hypothetical protein